MKHVFGVLFAVVCTLSMTMTAMGAVTQTLTELDPPKPAQIVQMGEDGHLIYPPYDDEGDIMIDFSRVGYKNGDEPIPEVPVVMELEPSAGEEDDTAYIQAAIDKVSELPMDQNGIRGALLLKKGTYRIANSVYIKASGVVLRGEGDSTDGTVVLATGTEQYNPIIIQGSGSATKNGDQIQIVDTYVGVGARTFTVEDASSLNLGDEIIVYRPSTEEWISDIGMDQIPAPATQWAPGSYDFQWQRRITKIDGNTITIESPITTALDKQYGGGSVFKYTWEGRVSNCAVENIYMDSTYTSDTDEKHGWMAVQIKNAVDCWVQHVTAIHYAYSCVSVENTAQRVTVQDCTCLDMKSRIVGGLRYSFNLCGQQILITRCYAETGRHDWVNGSQVLGPNVFYDNVSVQSNAVSEPHHRWASGTLYDNVVQKNPNSGGGTFEAVNRGNSGTGHGWAGANIVFWNCTSSATIVSKPPTAQNFAVGVGSLMPADEVADSVESTLSYANKQGGTQFEYEGQPLIGNGYIESPTGPVTPQSLYVQQRLDWEASEEYRIDKAVLLVVDQPNAIVHTKQVPIDAENDAVKPVIIGDRTLVPVRFISENFGAVVDFDSSTDTVSVDYQGKHATMVLGENILNMDGEEIVLDVPAQDYNDRTFIPIRALAEQLLGKKVFWDDKGFIAISDFDDILDSEEDAATIDNLIESIKRVPTADVDPTKPVDKSHARAAVTTGDVAYPSLVTGATVISSGDYSDGYIADYAIDNNMSTRWASTKAEGTGSWLLIDFQKPVTYKSIKLFEYNTVDRIKEVKLEASDDGTTFTEIATLPVTRESDKTYEEVTFPETTSQYLKVTFTDVTEGTDVTIYEIEVPNAIAAQSVERNPNAVPIVGVTANGNDGNVEGNTIDGNLATRWSMSGTDGQWIQWELEKETKISSVDLAFYSGDQRIAKFDIMVSTDGKEFTKVLSAQGSGTLIDLERFSFEPVDAKYVKFVGYGNSLNAWNSITEVSINPAE